MNKLPPLGRRWPLTSVEVPGPIEDPYRVIGKYRWLTKEQPITQQELATLPPPDEYWSRTQYEIYIWCCKQTRDANYGRLELQAVSQEHIAWAKSRLAEKVALGLSKSRG